MSVFKSSKSGCDFRLMIILIFDINNLAELKTLIKN